MWMTYRHVQAEISVDNKPRDVSVHEGDNVTFVCDLSNVQGYTIYWSYSGSSSSYLTLDRDVYSGDPQQASQSVKKRISIVGDADKEEFSLRIQTVQESDSGDYSCLYTLPEGYPTTAGKATLTVLVPPTPPYPICGVEGSSETGTVGDQVNLVCSALGGNPLPNITITNEDEIITEAYQAASITHPYTLKAEDNGVVFTCTMATPALDAPRSCSVMPLMILPTVTISPLFSIVEEGANILLECNATGVPSIYRISWEIVKTNTRESLTSDKYSLSNDGHTLSLKVTESIVLSCIASVPSGLSNNSTVRIEVTPRDETITEEMNTQANTTDPRQSSFFSSVITIIVVVGVSIVILIIIIILVQWQRKKKRKSKIPIDPKVGYKMTELEDEYDELGRRNGTNFNDENSI